MYRFLVMIAFVAFTAFIAMAVNSQYGMFSYSEMQSLAQAFVGCGMLSAILGTAASSWRPADGWLYRYFVYFGIIMGAFGLGILPISHLAIIEVPINVALATATALIVARRVPSEYMGTRMAPVLAMMLGGSASIWTLATGSSVWLSTALLGVGVLGGLYLAHLRPVEKSIQQLANSELVGADSTL